MATRVVIENAVLHGSRDGSVQIVATVYLDGGEELRVIAPEKATGDALEWILQLHVRRTSREMFGGDEIIQNGISQSVIQKVAEELERRKLDSDIWNYGVNPDARYYAAQICLRGHVQSSDGKVQFKRGEHCPQCGDACIDACPHCKAPIRGQGLYETSYVRPSYCYKCARPYLWMADRLQTAKELLYHDDRLTEDDRQKLWDLLQYVLSDPKSDLVPAKKKLIQFSLAKALPATREFVENIIAKYAAEMSK